MNLDQILSLTRSILIMAGSWFVQKGYLSGSDLEAIAGAVVTITTVAWGIYVHSSTQKLKQVAEYPEVACVKVKDPELAKAVPSDKVTL